MTCEGYDVSDEDGDDAVWQDLVERYGMPTDAHGAAPWPDRESLGALPGGNSPAGSAPAGRAPDDRAPDDRADSAPGSAGARVIRPASPSSLPGAASATFACPANVGDIVGALDAGDAEGNTDATDEHYVPPPPPPLPHLDPVAKGAWTALFGGPAYLLLTTLMGWAVPGWAALLAVTAFVGGFAVLVLRLGDGPSRGAGPDNGAVL